MEFKREYDVIIVGSGPAGAAAAKAISESGLETLIVERDELPRYKMCSGIVFPVQGRLLRIISAISPTIFCVIPIW